MKQLNENLSKLLDVEPIDMTPIEVLPAVVDEVSGSKADIDEDFEFARKNMKDLIKQGNSAVEQIISVAKATDHPRAYEVVATLINSVAAMNKDLMDIRKKKQDITGEKKTQNINVDKAVFVGSTAELIRQIKENK
jgi:hypothetical protein